jgi:nitrile hydratase accessory protein
VSGVRPEVAFEEPWQARAFATAVAVVEERGLDWDVFRQRLVAAVAAAPDRPYWESWVAALEDLADALATTGAPDVSGGAPSR